MKRNKINFLILAVPILLLAASCKKSFFTDVNTNPNGASTVGPNLLLSTVEASLAYTQGGDIARFASLITQQTFGAASQTQTYYIYGFNPGNFDNVWPDLYTSTMENNYTLINIADKGGYDVYSGVSRILMAYTLQVTVDCWGKIPYSQAFTGNAGSPNLHPVFDDDKALYDTIVSLINVGIAKLSTSTPGAITPGADDILYSGNTASWIRFAHAIKARLYLHQSKNNATMANNALAEIAQSFSSNKQNASYIFGTAETAANPWYQFNRDRAGNIYYSQTTIAAQLLNLSDPRYSIYIDSANDLPGKKVGNHWGGLNDYYGSVNSPIEFITYDELLFAKAEATITATGSIASAQPIYQAAIQANMQKLGVDPGAITTYIAAQGTLPVSGPAEAIGQIASQAYLALYLSPEAWTTWRRTNSPSLLPVSGSAVPRRLLYPQSEYSYNTANVPANVTITSPKIFWDN